ncbi:hypothetical protein V8G54_027903 [Vigna mungo]|uniref:Carboxypeptidase n=1 Tax=Vigna mungo TaxID=3915 RepID=A0AAQ3MR91_VIGMU
MQSMMLLPGMKGETMLQGFLLKLLLEKVRLGSLVGHDGLYQFPDSLHQSFVFSDKFPSLFFNFIVCDKFSILKSLLIVHNIFEHPQYAKNDFFITGESYAGHYIPAFATRVHRGNKAKEGIHINLKGFAIGNGLTNPAIQYKAYPDYAFEMGIIKKATRNRLNKVLVPACELAIKLCGTDGKTSCVAAYVACNLIFSDIMLHAGDANYYDIRKKCEGSLCYDFSNMEKFLNQKSVRESLGVGKIHFVSCSTEVYMAMLVDWMRNLEVGIPDLLEDGINLLIYAGEYDLICNWLGNSRWVHALEWSGKNEFATSLEVHDAGHMVPMDQPKAALEMLKKWTNGSLSESRAQKENLVAEM